MKHRSVRSAAFLLLLFASLTRAQAILSSQSNLVFTAGADGSVQAQTITLTSSGASLLLNVSVTTYNTGNWLYASPAIVSTPGNIIVSANANQLPQGVYNGAIMVSASGATNSPVAILVSLTVGSPPPAGTGLGVTPASLSFIGQAGGMAPDAQQLAVTSTPSGVTFTTTAAASDNGNWLQVSTLLTTAPATVAVSVNTAGMPAGVYSGSITFTPVSGSAVTVPVTLTLGGGSTLQTSASALQFFYQLGWFLPAYQTFDISSSGAPLAFAVVTSTTDGTGWLTATPSTGNTKQTITVSITPSGALGPGTYTGTITISSPTALNNTVAIPVTLTVSNSPLLTVGPSPAPFVYQTGGAAPPAQSVAIGSTSAPVSFTATTSTTDGNGWLAISPAAGTTPQNLTVVVGPGSLGAGTYSGTISVASSAVSNSPVKIAVTMTISTASQLIVNVQSIDFNYQTTGQNQVFAQQLGIYSSGLPVDVTIGVTTTSCGPNWLRSYQTSITTPQVITIAFDPLLLTTPGNCQAVITLTTAGATPVTIPVTLTVSNTPLLNIRPLELNFSAPFDGDVTPAQTVNLLMTDYSAAPYTATVSTSNGGNWMKVSPVGGTTPAAISVTANPYSLGSGTYTGNVVVGSPALTTARFIPVTFKVTPTASVTATPLSLSFTQASGGPAPAAQNVSLASTRGDALAFTVSTSAGNAGSWLSATPNTGNTPASVAVSVNGSALAPGTYQGSVTLSLPAAMNSPVTIAVTLVVTASQSISAATASLTFTYQAGGATPASQTVSVTSTTAGLNVTALAASTGNWLSVTPASGTAPATFTVSVVPAGLTPGTYNGTVTLSAPGAAGTTIRVELDVSAAPSVGILQIANAASGVRGVISPGEIVTINGQAMGPANGVKLNLTAAGTVDTTLAGTRVLFDEFAAPLLYVSAQQINAIVPYEVAGRSTVQVTVQYQGAQSAAYTMQLGATAPGIFTVTQNGRGQGAILNQDNSYNSASSPAATGSVVQVFGTGEGVLFPMSLTGSVTAGILLPVASVSATVGGVPATVAFAGAAPGQVAGLVQVNLTIPRGVPAGDDAITITIGGVASQTGVTVAVK